MTSTPLVAGQALASTGEPDASPDRRQLGWRELWRTEDWWAVWLGLAIVLIAYASYSAGGGIGWIAVAPARWSNFPQLGAHFAANAGRYAVQFVA
jgi:hypothetical protein